MSSLTKLSKAAGNFLSNASWLSWDPSISTVSSSELAKYAVLFNSFSGVVGCDVAPPND